MVDMKIRELGMLESILCFSRLVEGENNTTGRVIIDENGNTLTKSTRFFEDVDLCEGDLVNTFNKLIKQSHDHVMGELEY